MNRNSHTGLTERRYRTKPAMLRSGCDAGAVVVVCCIVVQPVVRAASAVGKYVDTQYEGPDTITV
jgi:hypothetical protein